MDRGNHRFPVAPTNHQIWMFCVSPVLNKYDPQSIHNLIQLIFVISIKIREEIIMISGIQQRKLMRLFCLYDINNDGFLELKDFEQRVEALSNIENISRESSIYKNLMDQYFLYWVNLKNEADQNQDDQISLEEWFNYFEQVLQDEKRYKREVESIIATMLDVFDSNKDGKLDRDEWSKFLQSYNVSPIYVDLIFPLFDSNNDGFLDQADLLKGFHEFFFSDYDQAKGNFIFGCF